MKTRISKRAMDKVAANFTMLEKRQDTWEDGGFWRGLKWAVVETFAAMVEMNEIDAALFLRERAKEL